jgi:hypothetical protein
MTTRAQAGGVERDLDVLRTIARERAACLSAGIECAHRVTDELDSPLHGIASDGPRAILVHESDLETARALLADAER